MAACLAGFLVIALALGELEVPHGRTVWGALIVTGVFASALAYLIQVWAQRRISAARIAIVFSLETVFAGIFGYWLADDRLGWLGWGGCARDPRRHRACRADGCAVPAQLATI